MNIQRRDVEAGAILVLFIITLFIWTLPLHTNPLPFGDVDASSHFTIGDFMVDQDRSILEIPYALTFRYEGQNNLNPSYLWYPPQYWTNTGIAQLFGGHRTLSVFIFVALFSSLIVLSSYFLIRKLLGFWPAFLSSFLLIFSTRDIMIYLWGQWPQSFSFAFTPLVLYCIYTYYTSTKEGRPKQIYLYLLSIFLAAQFFFHPQGLIVSGATIIFFTLFWFIKNKKIPFKVTHVAISIVFFALLCVSLAPLNVGEFFIELTTPQGGNAEESESQIGKLFKWYHIKEDAGLPAFYFEYKSSHGSLISSQNQSGFFKKTLLYWTLPFLLIGLALLVYRRKDQDLLLLSWFLALYFLTRLTVFGMGQRDIRMFAFEAHVFYPIIVFGLLGLAQFAAKSWRPYLKYGFVALFLILAISINGVSAYTILKSQQQGVGRINAEQYAAVEWIKANTPPEADVYVIGTAGYQFYGGKVKWLGVLAQRHVIQSDSEQNMTDYVLFDLSDSPFVGQQYYDGLRALEAQQFQNVQPRYQTQNIRVYQVAN